MKTMDPTFAEEYTAALREHLLEGGERGLLRAHELGRLALDRGIGILAMTALHSQSIDRIATPGRRGTAGLRDRASAETFLLETLSPFEMTHQGFRDALEALRRVNEMLEAEGRRIAHALHDETSQSLAAACISIDAIGRGLPEPAREHLQAVGASLRETAERLRQISHELRPTVLDDLGLKPALEFLAEGVAERTGLHVAIEGDTEGRLPVPVETAIYRVAQEALANAFRHGHARCVEVRLRRDAGAMHAVIRDDGDGFDSTSNGRSRGIGVLGMRERVHALGGKFRIASGPGCGTEIVIEIPLEKVDAHSSPTR